MKDVYIVAAGRTAIGSFNGALASVSASQLGATVIAGLLKKIGLPLDSINEVILGQVLTANQGQNPARQASIGAGLGVQVPATTINQVCGSGLKAIQLAYQAIRCNDATLVIAGGQENMSLAPHCLSQSRQGKKMGHWPLTDTLVKDGLWDAYHDYHMGQTAENIVQQFGISRAEQDAFAASSQQKAIFAQEAGHFQAEIIPVALTTRSGTTYFDRDEYPRAGVEPQNLAQLKPAFDPQGTVTAGNASGINDGAAVVILASAEAVAQYQLTPLARIVAMACSGVEPALMGTGPIPATKACLEKSGWDVTQLDLIEANEAFAAQALWVNQALELPQEKVNVNGGAIALGHPIGASGARILVTLVHQLQRQGAAKGLATLCVGGGQGVAITVENMDIK